MELSAKERELDLSQQNLLIAALCEALTNGEELFTPQLIETHISFVLIVGGFAYKIKKAVDLGFVNFTTLDARRFYCGEEVRLNRRFAPHLYLGTISVTGTVHAPRIDGDGKVLEFAVKMRAFPQDSLADNLVARGRVSLLQIDELAAALARFHLTAKRANQTTKFGEPESILARALENFDDLLRQPVKIDSDLVRTLKQWTKEEFARFNDAFEHRKRADYVRECHGDLHLGNIVCLDGRLTLFDCIEFNDDLRWIDVISDIAFLTMDLDLHGRQDLSARLLNQYIEITGDYEGVKLLRYYQVYRAAIRAKVAALKIKTQSSKPVSVSEGDGYCNLYLSLAQRYVAPKKTALIISHGFSGSGKTTLTQSLLEQVGAIRIRSDVERKRMHGMPALEHSDTDLCSGIYGAAATNATYQRLIGLARSLLTASYPVIVDATFLRRSDRRLFHELAEQIGVPFFIVDADAPVPELRRRIVQRADKGCDASEATLAVLEEQLASQDPFTVDELPYVFRVDSTRFAGLSDSAVMWKPLLARLGLRRTQRRNPPIIIPDG